MDDKVQVEPVVALNPQDVADLSAHYVVSSFANRFYVIVGPVNTRIVFAEVVSGATTYHSAITLETANALELADLIKAQASKVLTKATESPVSSPAEKQKKQKKRRRR